MQKFISKNLFWILQLIGWLSFSGFIGLVAKKHMPLADLLIIALVYTSTLLCLSSLLRLALNKFAPLDTFNFISVLKVLGFIVIVILLIPEVLYWLGYIFGRISRILEIDLDVDDLPAKDPIGFFKYLIHGIILIGWTIFFYIIKLLRKSNQERLKRLRLKDELKQAQINTLKGHLNPQFVFTSLNNIKGLMLEDVTASREMLTTLSEMLRYSLTKNNINFVKLEEELTIIENYIKLLKIADKDRFSVQLAIAPETLFLEVPPMLLSNLIELATKFGVLNMEQNGELEIVTHLKNNTLQLRVIHNGKATHSKDRLVLENKIKQRLKLIYGAKAKFMSNYEINKNTLWLALPITDSN
ncbi:histidine kinase [Cellulophaga baltica]|uniref:sensor histidine kinase n=1 Tax=Cellulophaga TaxID=104264 RepID=UPI001C07149B|nr:MULTISPECIES: histidine kinase [Cellulophaga]MBU2997121.1 histidine kinase [Cellulophaga baltica]MDO6768519.1 histidine kinase [Cellulophaga sp. 1_MG-2023]